MRNLFAFLRRFRVFLVFVLLQVFALSTYFSFLAYPRAQYLTSASNIAGSILKTRHDITRYLNLNRTNAALQRENIRLRKKMPQSFIQINRSKAKIHDTLFHQQYEYIPATVLNSTCTKRNNYFTINTGKLLGIKRGMGVFSDHGIVGIVHNSSKHFAVIKSVLTENINVDVMIQPIGLIGLLKWDGRDPRRGSISGITNDVVIKKGSVVVTRGGSGIFPRNLVVGKVEKLNVIDGKPLWDVVIRFSEDYRRLQRVYVIKNLLQNEQSTLEAKIPEDKEE